MNDKNNSTNNGNASRRDDPNRHFPERGPSEEPPVKKRKSETNNMSVAVVYCLEIEQIFSDIESGKDITTCDCAGRNAMHYASEFNRLDLAEAIVKHPNCRSLINSLNKRRESPVIVAAKKSYKHIVTFLLVSGAKFEIGDEYGMTLLHYASMKGWLDIVQDVLRKGFDINTLTFKRETALIIAAKHSNEELVSFLIGTSADCSYSNREKWGILHFAAKNGWLKTVLTVVKNGVDINAKTVESETALLLAAKFSFKDIVKALIGLGANFHCCDSKGWSLLHYASSYGWFDVAASIVNKNADIDIKTDIFETPLLLAGKNSHIQMVKYFIYLGVKFTCFDKFGRNMLFYSSKNGWKDITEYAISNHRMDMNAQTAPYGTAVQVAAMHKKEDVTSFLISIGANFHFRDKLGLTILHYAAAYGWLDIVQRVLKKVDANAKTHKSSTALQIACANSRKEVVTFLINAGVDIKCNDACNNTILHHAAKYGWLDVVESALKKGVYIDSLCVNKETPLLVAAQHSQQDVACLLILLGANTELLDRYKKAALHYAAEKGWVDVVSAAVMNGADLNVMNDTKDTPLHLACINKEIPVLKCLLQAGVDYNKKATGRGFIAPFSNAVKKCYVYPTKANVEAVKFCIVHGAFPELKDCYFISHTSLLKEGLLRNVKLCAQALINKFNNLDVPKVFALPFSGSLPPIEKAKIGENQMVVKEIEGIVQHIMDRNGGYCDLIWLYYKRPCPLSMLAVRTLLNTYSGLPCIC